MSRLLRDIFPSTFILHEDDFYWPDTQIPYKDGVQDWDCIEAIDVKGLQKALEYIKQHGTSPPDLLSKEDQNSVGESGVNEEAVKAWKDKANSGAAVSQSVRIAIVDGFLLFGQEMEEVWKSMDVRLFLRTEYVDYIMLTLQCRETPLLTCISSYATAKRRREARLGYVTLEGFWEDPPGYVDNIVWPNYVKEHAFLFQNGDVDGEVDSAASQRLALHVMPKEYQHDITSCLDWACEIVSKTVADAAHAAA